MLPAVICRFPQPLTILMPALCLTLSRTANHKQALSQNQASSSAYGLIRRSKPDTKTTKKSVSECIQKHILTRLLD